VASRRIGCGKIPAEDLTGRFAERNASVTSAPGPATINRHLEAVYPPFALLAGVRLGVFTALGNGPLTVEDLAGSLDVSAFKLETLLYGLVIAGLLVDEDGRIANTTEANHYLVEGRSGYLGHQIAYYAERWAKDLKTAESIRTGIPQGKLDYASMSEADLNAFYTSQHAGALAAGGQLAESCDLSGFRRLLDVAGGSGGLAIELCGRFPELRATVVDLPTVTPITERFVREAGMDDRVSVAAVDVVDRAPRDRYDVAVVKNFIQILTREQARRVLINVGRALDPGGVVFIIGYVLDDDHLGPAEIAASNYAFLNLYDEGRAFTEGAHRAWLTEAGFTGFERTLLPRGRSIIRAELPDVSSCS
jgi:SAM-dependent methyltransferase